MLKITVSNVKASPGVENGSYGPTAPLFTGTPPLIELTKMDVEERTGLSGGPTIAEIEVTDHSGLRSKFYVDVIVKNGRPILRTTTYVGKDREKQVAKAITGTFNMI